MARRTLFAALVLLASCSHLGESLVATMPTVGPRVVVLEAERPLRATPRGVLCLEAPEGYAVPLATAAFTRSGGEPVVIRASLATETGDTRLDLPVPSRRKAGDATFLCFGAAGAPLPGAAFDRVTLTATAPLLLPQIVWISDPR